MGGGHNVFDTFPKIKVKNLKVSGDILLKNINLTKTKRVLERFSDIHSIYLIFGLNVSIDEQSIC